MLKTAAALLAITAIAILALGPQLVRQAPRFGGQYVLQDRDHDEVMTSHTASPPTRTVAVIFVGNSLTFVNDMPAMLVNIAASDPGNTVRLSVKAETGPDAWLADLRTSGALDYVRTHHADYVVLQEHSGWRNDVDDGRGSGRGVADWAADVRSLGETPLLFEAWTDAADAAGMDERTARLAANLRAPSVMIGRAFANAARTPAAPVLYGEDGHHPSIAGSYLAALMFYRYFTGRSGAEATYRPWGMTAATAAQLVGLAAAKR